MDLLNLSHDALITSNQGILIQKRVSDLTTVSWPISSVKNSSLNFLGSTGHRTAFLSFQLTSLLSVSKYIAAELEGILVEKSDNAKIKWQEV